MSMLTDTEIRQAIERGEIDISPFDPDCLGPASYDLKLGKRAIITKALSLSELKQKVAGQELRELDVEKEKSISVPGGGFALVTSLESIRLSRAYAGHIGMKTYYVRKGILLLSGLQIDPGWDGVLVFGLANVSPRTMTLDFKDPLCTIELHRLAQEAGQVYDGTYMQEQREGRIPRGDRDYLRTIETMSVSELTEALMTLSRNIEGLSGQVRGFWYVAGIVVFFSLLTFAVAVLQIIVK
ncbi:MAG: 2'-deoxycytidine 5'-triphosphate deaminase [Chloroflexi bacterium]|nr:2'-deoxycytidine 5'-triphosphate deaminase [Chloroflexota bacterium]